MREKEGEGERRREREREGYSMINKKREDTKTKRE